MRDIKKFGGIRKPYRRLNEQQITSERVSVGGYYNFKDKICILENLIDRLMENKSDVSLDELSELASADKVEKAFDILIDSAMEKITYQLRRGNDKGLTKLIDLASDLGITLDDADL